jgi:outer membrane protein assembly factor BamB
MANHNVYAVDVQTGEALWPEPFTADHPVWAAPLVADGRVYVVSLDHHLYALDRADGATVWEKDLGASLAGTPALVDGTLYVGTFARELYALDAATGAEVWPQPFAQAENWIWSGPAERDGGLYFTDLSGNLFAVDARTGALRWQVKPGGVLRGTPAVTDELVIIGDKDGKLYARARTDGAERWLQEVPGGGQLLASPLLVPDLDLVLVAPYQGSNLLVAYTTTGALRWAFAPSQ